MNHVTIRELRNHGGDVIERVLAGECLTITRAGHPVAELPPLPKRGIDASALLESWKNLPRVNADGILDTNTVILLPRLGDPSHLP